MLYQICIYFLLFLSYSILGWLIEVVCCSIISKKLVINRGFLIGPYCPIYGVSALLMLFSLERYIKEPITLFLMAAIICSVMEYLTSYIMEKLFKARWWDYSEQKFNVNGRICLSNSLLFGLLGLLLLYVINPAYVNLLHTIPKLILQTITMILMTLFVTDVILSSIVMCKIKINSMRLLKKDATEEISKKVHQALAHYRLFANRTLDAFPRATSLVKGDPLKQLKDYLNTRKNKRTK